MSVSFMVLGIMTPMGVWNCVSRMDIVKMVVRVQSCSSSDCVPIDRFGSVVSQRLPPVRTFALAITLHTTAYDV